MANILVVQEAAQNTGEIKENLESGGHQILVAQNVESAKTLLEAASFDLLICAAHLNNGTVFDLLNFVKHDANRRTMPFLVFCCSQTELAKSVDSSLRSTALLLGADKCITQDVFNAEQLRCEIESFLPGRTNAPTLSQPHE
jgi:CheY-like chemotaxis protein